MGLAVSKSLPHVFLPRIGDAKMNQLIDSIERVLNRLEAHPFANLKILAPQAFTAFTNVRVMHGLGYPLSGFFVVSTPGIVNVALSAVVDPDPNNYVFLGANATTTITLAVF